MSEFESKKPRWSRRKEARPGELLDAALDMFVEHGFAATRLDDVAKSAGVSKGTLYLYFSSKEELFKAVVRENILPMMGEAEELVDQFPGTTAELFRTMIHGWWERVGNTRLSGIAKLIYAESGNFPDLARFHYEEVVVRGNQLFRRLLERGIARGEFREIDIEQTVRLIGAPVLMLVLWQHVYGKNQIVEIDSLSYIESYIDLYLNGLLKPQK